MPVTPERKNSLVLARDFRDEVTRRTGITDFDSDSKTEALISVFVNQVLSARNETIGAFYANQISSATGKQLDMIGQDLGLPRMGQTFAAVQKRDQNFAFFVASGTFGDINGGSPIVIPEGTQVSSVENANDLGARISFNTTETTTLQAGSSIGYASVRAIASGTTANLGGGMLNQHDFTTYTAGTGLKCVNFYAVLTGRPDELDRNYKFRLSRRYDTLVSSNNAKLHLEALRVPGVLDTRVVNGHFGVGSVGVIVLGPENQSNAQTVRGVQARLSQLQGPGSSFVAVSATSVSFDIEMKLKPTRPLTSNEKRQLELQVRRGLRNYFRSEGIAGTASLEDAAKEVRAYVQGVARLSSLGNPESIFETVFVRKGPSSATGTERELLKNSFYTLDVDEYADLGTLSLRYL